MKNFFLGSVIILLLFSVLYQIDVSNNLHSRVDTLNSKFSKMSVCDEATMREFANQQYKEDFYLTQLGDSTTLILSVIGFALILAGLFSFKHIDEKFKNFETIITSKIEENKEMIKAQDDRINNFINSINEKEVKSSENFKSLRSEMLSFKNDLDYELVTIKENDAKQSLGYNDFENYLFYTLYSNSFRVKCIKYYSNRPGSEELATRLKNILKTSLEKALENLKSNLESSKVDRIFIEDTKPHILINFIGEINELNDKSNFKTLSEIYSLLSFPEVQS